MMDANAKMTRYPLPKSYQQCQRHTLLCQIIIAVAETNKRKQKKNAGKFLSPAGMSILSPWLAIMITVPLRLTWLGLIRHQQYLSHQHIMVNTVENVHDYRTQLRISLWGVSKMHFSCPIAHFASAIALSDHFETEQQQTVIGKIGNSSSWIKMTFSSVSEHIWS